MKQFCPVGWLTDHDSMLKSAIEHVNFQPAMSNKVYTRLVFKFRKMHAFSPYAADVLKATL